MDRATAGIPGEDGPNVIPMARPSCRRRITTEEMAVAFGRDAELVVEADDAGVIRVLMVPRLATSTGWAQVANG